MGSSGGFDKSRAKLSRGTRAIEESVDPTTAPLPCETLLRQVRSLESFNGLGSQRINRIPKDVNRYYNIHVLQPKLFPRLLLAVPYTQACTVPRGVAWVAGVVYCERAGTISPAVTASWLAATYKLGTYATAYNTHKKSVQTSTAPRLVPSHRVSRYKAREK